MATVAQVSTQQEWLSWKWGRATYVPELQYQLLSTHMALRDLRERKIWQGIYKTIVLALMWKPNSIPSRHLVLLKQKLIIHCSEQTFLSGLSPAVQILLGAHTLDTSSQDSQYCFSNIWIIRKSLDSVNQQHTLRNRQLLKSKCAQSNNCQPVRHFT